MVGGVLDFSKNERTNGADEKRKRRRKTPVWYLNVQIVARGNDASFGASDFRHRAWSDRDRRRHLQKVFLVVVVFEEQSLSLSLSLSPIGRRGRGAQRGGSFKNRETLNFGRAEKRVVLRNNKDITLTTAKTQSNDAKGEEDDDFDDVIVDGESRLVRAVFFVLVGEERERGTWKSTNECLDAWSCRIG